MRIAVSATRGDLSSEVEPRFGRSRWFLVFDSETGEHTIIDNLDASESPSGAGIATAQRIVGAGATCVLTGRVGPNASRVLDQAGVRVVDGVAGPARDAAERVTRGEL